MKKIMCLLLCFLITVAACSCVLNDALQQVPNDEIEIENQVENTPEQNEQQDVISDEAEKEALDEALTGDENTDITEEPEDAKESEIAAENAVFNLYFPDKEALFLHKEERTAVSEDGKADESLVIKELFKGPQNPDLSPAVIGEELVNSISTDENGVCTVDFKSDFVILNTGGTSRENFAIGAIVNSLCELENVNGVLITIDGKTNVQFGHIILEAPLGTMSELVEE